VSRPGAGGLEVVRTRRTRTPEDWFGRGEPPRVLREPVPATALPGEFLLNALRLVEGVPEELLEARTGVSLERVRPTLEALRRDGLLRADRLATTPRGLRFLDRVTGAFLA
jgi:oxygen-independent coproporphyrinogen-3 oxidase